eukprot:tig00000989_g6095.t1
MRPAPAELEPAAGAAAETPRALGAMTATEALGVADTRHLSPAEAHAVVPGTGCMLNACGCGSCAKGGCEASLTDGPSLLDGDRQVDGSDCGCKGTPPSPKGPATRPLFPGCSIERPLWAWLRPRLNLAEISGSLGDLGTFIPLVLAMSKQNGLDFGASLLLAGIYNVITGCHFAIPMAVQPMKAIAAVALKEKLSVEQIMAAGILVSGTVFFLGITRLVNVINRVIPTAVIKGMQLGLGLNFLTQGFGYATQSGWWWGGLAGDCVALGIVCGLFVLAVQPFRRVPAALVLFVVGLVCAVAGRATDPTPNLSPIAFGPSQVRTIVPSAEDFKIAFVKAAIPQIPLTTLNSVVSVSALAVELFPSIDTRPAVVAVAVGLMNLFGGWFGSTPYCHGAGGLAGQYKFGARSNVSILFLGCCKIVLYLVFGSSIGSLLKYFPLAILGVLLGVSGLELASSVRDQNTPRAMSLALITAAGVILYQTSAGLAIGVACATVVEVSSRFSASPLPALDTAATLVFGPTGVLALMWPPAGAWRSPPPAVHPNASRAKGVPGGGGKGGGDAEAPAPALAPVPVCCSSGVPLFASA